MHLDTDAGAIVPPPTHASFADVYATYAKFMKAVAIFGPLTTLSYANGTTKTMSYDARYRVTENKLTGPSGTIADYTYSEDPAGNITSIHDATDPTYNRDFTYDDLNRLVTANSGTSLWGRGSYAYDAMGNLTSRSLGTAPMDDGTVLSVPGRHLRASASVTGVVDNLAFSYTSTTPQISVATWNGIDHTVTYDLAGNEISYFATRTYSPRNLLATVTDNSGERTAAHTISYGYDARGVRVTRSESPTASGTSNRYFTYSAELQLLSITDDDSSNLWASGHASILSAPIAPSHEFAYFNGMPVGEFGPPRTPDSTMALSQPRHTPFAAATTLYYTFTDHLGTPLLQTDSTGTVVWRAEYEPYGNVWKMRKASRTDQPLRLPGQDLAMTWEGAEENYNVFRWYRAGWGRYTQADPIGLRGGMNLFGYGARNPVDYIDAQGLKVFRCQRPLDFGKFGGKVTGFLVSLVQMVVMPYYAPPKPGPGNQLCATHDFLYDDDPGSFGLKAVGAGPNNVTETSETLKGASCEEVPTKQGKCAMKVFNYTKGHYNTLANNCHAAVQHALDVCSYCQYGPTPFGGNY